MNTKSKTESKVAHPAATPTRNGLHAEHGPIPSRRTRLRYVVGGLLVAGAPCAWPQVSGGQVTSGRAEIAQAVQSGTTTITQSTETATISWKTFNVGASDTVNFIQPSKQSLTINRIADPNGSSIMGRINATGQVWLINPNGVLFGQGAQINVGSILASALSVADATAKPQPGNWSVDARGDSLAAVTNQGQINVAPEGYVALLAHRVSNTGSIAAPAGSVVMGAGSAISVQFQNNKLLGIEISQHQLDALVHQSGLISADGGQVLLSAGARASLLASAVNQSGRIQARTASMQQGKIVLSAGTQAGQLAVGGTIDATAPDGGDAGRVEMSGASLQFADNWQTDTSAAQGRTGHLMLSAGNWSVDRNVVPESFNAIRSDTVSKLLAVNNLTLLATSPATAAGDIAINGSVSWVAPTTLALRAAGDVRISDVLTSGHAAGALQLAYGLAAADGVIAGKRADYWIGAPVNLRAGANFSTQLGASGAVKTYTVITALGQAGSTTGVDLQGISQAPDQLAKNYVLGADIDASETSKWNKGAGFNPLFSGDAQTEVNSFQGVFDGLGHVISGLVINRPTSGVQSLITSLGSKGVIQNLGLRNIAYNSHNTGGIVFRNFGLIRNSFVDGGYLKAADNFKNLSNFVGGLAGDNYGQIMDSYANVTVSMQDPLGSYRTDSAYAYRAGGLVGMNSGSIVNSYAKGQVLVSDRILTLSGVSKPVIVGGGLVGFDASASAIVSSYWVTPSSAIGPTAGVGWSAVNQPVGQRLSRNTQSNSALTRSATQAAMAQSFSDWDLSNRWLLYEGYDTPYLRAFMTPLYVQVSNPMEKMYDSGRSIDTSATTLPQGLSKNLWGNLVGLLAEKNAGVQKVYAAGLYSDQTGYQVRYEYQQPTVLVKKAPLRVSGVKAVDKAYDGTSYAVLDVSALQMDGLISGDDVSVKFSGNFVGNDQGTGKQVLLDAQIAGVDRRNYDIVLQADTVANITKPTQSYLSEPTNDVTNNNTLPATKPVNPAVNPVVNPVQTPQQESPPREVYDKFDKYLAVQPQKPVQNDVANNNTLPATKSGNPVVNPVVNPVQTPQQESPPREVYDKFDKYLAVQPQKLVQNDVTNNNTLLATKSGNPVVNPVQTPQQESPPREVYDKFDKYLAVQPQKLVQNDVTNNNTLPTTKSGNPVVNPVQTPQQESPPREVYDKFDKYLAVQPQKLVQNDVANNNTLPATKSGNPVVNPVVNPVQTPQQESPPREVYDKFDRYLVSQAQSNVQALRDSSLKVANEVPSAHKQAERQGDRSGAISDANTAKSSPLEDDADAKTQDPRIGAGIEAHEKKSAARGKPVPVTLSTTCSPSSQDGGASVRITCQPSNVGGKR